jgi:hypothetical protein
MPQYIWILHFSSKSHITTRRCTKLMVFFKCTTMGKKGTCRCIVLQHRLSIPLEKIKTSVFLVYGSHDTISRVEVRPRNSSISSTLECLQDNQELLRKLPGDVVLGQILVDNFNHLDFFFGRRRTEMYDKIMKLLENTTN